jgi:hypothetical protein
VLLLCINPFNPARCPDFTKSPQHLGITPSYHFVCYPSHHRLSLLLSSLSDKLLIKSSLVVCFTPLATAVLSMERSTICTALSSNRICRSFSSLRIKILILTDCSSSNIVSRSLLHCRQWSIRWATLCLLSLHHQHHATCTLLVLSRRTPVTALPDFSCRYRAVTAFLPLPICLFIFFGRCHLLFMHLSTYSTDADLISLGCCLATCFAVESAISFPLTPVCAGIQDSRSVPPWASSCLIWRYMFLITGMLQCLAFSIDVSACCESDTISTL